MDTSVIQTWITAAVCRVCGCIGPRRDVCVFCGGAVLFVQVTQGTVDVMAEVTS